MTDLKQAAETRLAEVEPDLVDLSRWMYENPETGLEEHNTSARIASLLAANGFEVEYPAYGLETAFAARAGSSGPEVVICAEYDALPKVGHACGHNIIAASSVGAGIAVAGLADQLGCRVTVLGTPAEEGHGGKVDLINAGAFEGAAASMLIHPAPTDSLIPEILAVQHLEVDFHGKDSHAAASPQLGINALDAFVQAYVNVSTLRQHILPGDRIHGIVTHGGDAPNVVPSFTSSSWYVRAETKARLDELVERVTKCFEAGALATGCTYEVKTKGNTTSDLISNPVMAEIYGANSAAVGRPMPAERVKVGASTDMGNVSHVVPSIHPSLAIDAGNAVNHQPEFAAATINASGEKAIHDGALAMAWTIVDLAVGDRWGDL